ncbi:uncharacterized protein LOC121784261 [Salvia splendens]|uniref:uncharacterized protein LOC121784261 n=1 Tax=Salvia splendens TaxID=180675 RepID=UPI001C26BB47|nr:uncharacterized protein LOC121784261 [Salvia splendens]
MADYVKVLNGPNGSPNWYVDVHPMRVFKWAPDFDTFFESPIVSVWCNIIDIPAHLYEESAIMAIGNLLGKPLQADHATIHQSRLSFARICVEIDISIPPPEEIILNIRGKDSRYNVAWDRFPLFCANCKHVGHVKEDCHASGRKNRVGGRDRRVPTKAFYSSNVPKITRQEWRPKADTWACTSSTSGYPNKAKECTDQT